MLYFLIIFNIKICSNIVLIELTILDLVIRLRESTIERQILSFKYK